MMSQHTAYSDFEVKIGKRTASYGEVRITYTIDAGRPARTWANAMDGNFYPAEGPDVQVEKVEYRFGHSGTGRWITDESDLLLDIDTAWLLEQAAEVARNIEVYGTTFASVKSQIASVIAEQAREGWAFSRISVRKADDGNTLYTHVAELKFTEAAQ